MTAQFPPQSLTPNSIHLQRLMDQLPPEVKKWAESLPWTHRRYVLSLCHLLCAAPPEVQAEFLDDYTADGLVYKMIQDHYTKQKVSFYLIKFHIATELTETLLRGYIRQFYIHSAHDVRRQPAHYLESVLRLVINPQEKNNVFNYILGFELLKMMFKMSWLQHERLYKSQINQEAFLHAYIKPIQYAHRLNGVIYPKDENVFFAKRDYYVQQPEVSDTKVRELVISTFPTKFVSEFGFSIIRHPNSLNFDYDYIFSPETDEIFANT
ncbi:cobyrinic acid a,c-diamide synthase [Geitlerinema splendidum]|nr:cobyrinic acid a,c-diamide synthase [Geitlerinema splendidum]